MPLGFERLNERSQRPNANINFIKPWSKASSADQLYAQTFLERIAAQCFPVMKNHHLYVQSLEEFPPNKEFLGRNFNAGECIQLVLKDRAGRWLGFQFVQMVMMHELAHCKQMNHSRSFWHERNTFAKQMQELWMEGYLGQGLWGRGQDLVSGDFVGQQMPDEPQIPEHLCGGAYRKANRRKRKRDSEKPKVTYAEKQQRRITKRFGKHGEGNALGEDEMVRGALEEGNWRAGKPKVAKSKRGRDLRANAALARLEAGKFVEAKLGEDKRRKLSQEKGQRGEAMDSDEGTDWSDESSVVADDARAGRIKDERGNDLVQVCGDEGEQEDGGEGEKMELQALRGHLRPKLRHDQRELPSPAIKPEASISPAHPDVDTNVEKDVNPPSSQPDLSATAAGLLHSESHVYPSPTTSPSSDSRTRGRPCALLPSAAHHDPAPTSSTTRATCAICSLNNDASATTCMACSHVLKPHLMKDRWRCKSEACKGSSYINAGDVGRCGLCGMQKPPTPAAPMSVTGSSILRWD